MLEQFLTYLKTEKRVSEHTIKAYENDLCTFFEYALIEKPDDLNEISYQNIRGWIVELVNHQKSNRTVNRKLSTLRTFFKWALRNKIIEANPMLRVKGPKQEKRLPEFIKVEEMDLDKMDQLFSDTFEGLRDRLMIELFYQTGIRLSEMIHLKVNDFQTHQIKVLGKRNKERIIPVSQELSTSLEVYLCSNTFKSLSSECVFTTNKGKKMYPNFVYRRIKYYLSLMTNLKKRSPHVLRHTFATHMLNKGAGLESLKEILGHANLSATQVYTHNSFDQVAKIYKQAHPRGSNKS